MTLRSISDARARRCAKKRGAWATALAFFALSIAAALASCCLRVGTARAEEATHIASVSGIGSPLTTVVAYGDRFSGQLLGLRGDYGYRPSRYFQVGAGLRYHQYHLAAETHREFTAVYEFAGVLPVVDGFELTLSPCIGIAYSTPSYGSGGAGPFFGIDLGASWRMMEKVAVLFQIGASASSMGITSSRHGETKRLAASLPLSLGVQLRC